MEYIIPIVSYFIPSIITLIIFIILKYMQNIFNINKAIIIIIIFGVQLLFVFILVINNSIYYNKNKYIYNQIVDPTGKNDGIFNYDNLTDEEKMIVNRYIGDGGRNIGSIFYTIICIFNFIIFSFTSIIIDIIKKYCSKMQKREY